MVARGAVGCETLAVPHSSPGNPLAPAAPGATVDTEQASTRCLTSPTRASSEGAFEQPVSKGYAMNANGRTVQRGPVSGVPQCTPGVFPDWRSAAVALAIGLALAWMPAVVLWMVWGVTR